MSTHLAAVVRLPDLERERPEIKDPSIVRLGDGRFMMFATIGRSDGQSWAVGRFVADHPAGPWQELPPVRFHDLAGPQLCAPAVVYEEHDGRPRWRMFIQTACFEEDGVIALATSDDGLNFHGQRRALASRFTLDRDQPAIVGAYDAGVSRIRHAGKAFTCLLFTGCNRVGDGDIYATLHDESQPDDRWTPARRVLRQDEVSFHNRRGYEHYEWGLEGAVLVQLAEDAFLMIGVCFLERPADFRGRRQRVFFAVSRDPLGPFVPTGTPLEPHAYAEGEGENGHPDAVVDGDGLWLVYQERAGEGRPWHLRHARFELARLRDLAEGMLRQPSKAA